MALWSKTKDRELPRPTIDVTGMINKYDLVDVDPAGIIIVAEKAPMKMAGDRTGLDLRELGKTGATGFSRLATAEYNPKLMGKQGMRIYDEMRKSDGEAKALLRLVKTPVVAARWYVEPASDSKQDKLVADFVWDCLSKFQSSSWPQLLTEILLMLDFGYYIFEKVFDIRDGRIIWKKIAPRHPLDVEQWIYDPNGGPDGMFFLNGGVDRVWIPIDKMMIFTNDKEAGNIEGVSVLRPAYKHWFYKDNLYKIDAIQKERHGIGIPVIKLPPNFNDADKTLAQEMGRNLRSNEKAHIVLPPLWDLIMLDLQGQPVDIMKSVEHHNHMMLHSVLGGFLDSPNEQVDEHSMFLKSTRYIADIIRDVFNKYAIPELVDYNWRTVTEYPELRVRRIGETVDWRTMSFAIRNFIGAGVIIPDETLEVWIREEMDLPRRDESTARDLGVPNAPGSPVATAANPTGGTTPPGAPAPQLPRQSTAPGMKITPGSKNVGKDTSGGK